MIKFSVIIPLYNRPDEIRELLDSISTQQFNNIEVIVVEDGSTLNSEVICNGFSDRIDIHYFFKENEGPGIARNYGATYAKGEFLLFLDSDCILPQGFFERLVASMKNEPADFFGGPDKAHKNFSPIQKAINYSMTSFFTTGGIRGGKKKLDKFYPRSFNMGIRKDAYNTVEGFSRMRFGEDIDLSTRLFEHKFKSALYSDAWVYHKRRTNFLKFYRQVYNSGIARINLSKLHPGTLKAVHLFPSIFVIGCMFCLLISPIIPQILLFPLIYSLSLFIDSSIKNRSLKIGLLSVIAGFTQLWGYGVGFIEAFFKRVIFKRGEFSAFLKNFYE